LYAFPNKALAQPASGSVPGTLPNLTSTPIPGDNLIDFPEPLKDFGANLVLDKSRLLLGFKNNHTRQEIASFLTTSFPPFKLEESVGSIGDAQLPRKINHTRRRFWVRTSTGSPITQPLVSSLVLTSESIANYALEWIGPVYSLPGTTGRRGLVCPLPHVIDVKPASSYTNDQLVQKLQSIQANNTTYKLKKISKQLSPTGSSSQEFALEPNDHRPIYALRDFLMSQNIASETRLHYMPLLKPTGGCAGWSGCWVSGVDLINSQWNMNKIRASQPSGGSGWDITKGVETIIMAILDDGCDLDHPDLKCNYFVEPGQTISGQTYSSGEMITAGGGITSGDQQSHGTWCIGVSGPGHSNNAGLKGLAGCCKILPLRLEDYTPETIVKAIDHAIAMSAKVMSISWGYDPNDYASLPGFWTPVDDALTRAHDANIVICAAAMNANVNRIFYPARNSHVIACGATNQSDRRCTITDWASYNDPDLQGSNKGDQLWVMAPGVDIPTTGVHVGVADSVTNYTWFAGTSVATPHVAGLAALILSLKPFTPDEVKNIIKSTAVKVGPISYDSTGWNNEYGYGRIDVRAALVTARDSSSGSSPPQAPQNLTVT
jgi:subtilisin family serine protease